MIVRLKENWRGAGSVEVESYVCGHCSEKVASDLGYYTTPTDGYIQGFIRICASCRRPTFFNKIPLEQVPGPTPGTEINNLPEDLHTLYQEARNCFTVNSYNAAILLLRKLLMHVAVEKGADKGKPFVYYVEYLSDHHYLGAEGKPWVDLIRQKSNEANHEIVLMSQDDAEKILTLAEMLLKMVYEFPAKVPKGKV